MRQQQRETKSFFFGSDEGGGGGGGRISSGSMGGAVLLTLEDDYLAPSQACVNPMFTTKAAVLPENDSSAAPPDQEENKNDSGGSNSNNSDNKKKQEGAVTVRRRRRREQKQPRAISSEVSNDPAADPAAAAVDATNADPSVQSHSQSQSERQKDEKPHSARQRPARDTVSGGAKKGNDSDLVQASVADCLACSGCITTAESVLLQDRHSLDKLRQAVGSFPRAGGSGNAVAKNKVVVTISPASAADLFRAVGLSLPSDRAQRAEEHRNALRRLSSLLNRALNGAVEAVLDGEAAQEWSLRAAAEEFCRAYRYFREQSQQQREECGDVDGKEIGRNGTRGPAASEAERLERDLCPSQAIDSTKSVYLVPAGGRDGGDGGNKQPSPKRQVVVNRSPESRGRTQQALPVLSGSCPAAVCLVEKSRWPAVPHLQTTKSPMALAGAFWRTKRRTTPPSPRLTSHFHLAIMPCHDKKLEASRKDFVPAETGRSDVDLVITTQECLDLLVEAEDKKTKEPGRSDMWCREESMAALKRYLSGDDEGSENHDNNSEDVSPTMADVQYVTNDMLCSSCTVEPLEKETRRPILITTTPSFDPPPHKECCKGNGITTSAANGCTGKNRGSGSCGSCKSARDNREDSEFYPFSGGGSADYIFRYAACELFGYQVRGPVPWKPYQVAEAAAAASGSVGRVVAPQQSARLARAAKRKRNVNYYHAALYQLPDGGYALQEPAAVEGGLPTDGSETGAQQPVLHFGIAHGMQTLQRVLQPFGDNRDEPKEGGTPSKRLVDGAAPAARKSPFHYVEAMACPSGACLNGGGQVRTGTAEKPQGGRERPAETQKRVRQTQAFHAAASSEHRLVMDKGPTSSQQKGILPPTEYHTTYHVVPPLQLNRGAVEGVAVEDMLW